MTIDTAKKEAGERRLIESIAAIAPGAKVVIGEFCGDWSHMLVNVYNVPDGAARLIRDKVQDLDLSGIGISYTPLIRNVEITRRYYPQYA